MYLNYMHNVGIKCGIKQVAISKAPELVPLSLHVTLAL